MLFEPLFCFPEAGTEPGNFGPEARRVIHFAKVREFMQDQVIADEGGSLHEAPVEGDGAAPGAGTPARALVAHGNPSNGQLVSGGQFEYPGG